MAAPTNAAKREESSCQHGAVHTIRTSSDVRNSVAIERKPDIARTVQFDRNDPTMTSEPEIVPPYWFQPY